MVCSSCGATIADKAIVCYRCGAPTAGPAATSRPTAGGGARTVPVLSAVTAVALGGLAFVLPDDSASQLASGAGAIAAAFGTAWLWLRKR